MKLHLVWPMSFVVSVSARTWKNDASSRHLVGLMMKRLAVYSPIFLVSCCHSNHSNVSFYHLPGNMNAKLIYYLFIDRMKRKIFSNHKAYRSEFVDNLLVTCLAMG